MINIRLICTLAFLSLGIWVNSAGRLLAFQPDFDEEENLYGSGLLVVDSKNKILGNFDAGAAIRYVNGTWLQFGVSFQGVQVQPPVFYYTSTNCTGQNYLGYPLYPSNLGFPPYSPGVLVSAYSVVSSSNDVTLYFAESPAALYAQGTLNQFTIPAYSELSSGNSCSLIATFYRNGSYYEPITEAIAANYKSVDIGIFTPPFAVKTYLQFQAERAHR